jgi:hypothetical protein
MFLTFQDSVYSLLDYLGAQPGDVVLRDAKKACIEALRDLIQSHTWTYLYTHGRIITTESFSDGLITFAQLSGLPPNTTSDVVTLTGGTWPSWSGSGLLRFNNYNYDVLQRLSGTQLQLRSDQAPTSDVTDPIPYGLFRDYYSLPNDFAAQDVTFIPLNFGGLEYCHPREWLMQTADWGVLGTPEVFTIMADPSRPHGLCIKLAPLPTFQITIEFIYKRHSHGLNVFSETAGSIVTAANSNVIVGTGTNFTSQMANTTCIRISGNNKPPTPEWGNNPAVFESKVTFVDPVNQVLSTFDNVPAAYANAPFVISNYIDIETGAMMQAYLRCCEMHISMNRILKDKPSAKQQYAMALEVAKCADSRNMMQRNAGPPLMVRRRLSDYPIDLTRVQ